MDTKVWGPLVWRLLEDVAWAVDSQLQPLSQDAGNLVLNFFYALTGALPCMYCRQSYSKFFEENPIGPAVLGRQLLHWVWELHEMVNNKLDQQARDAGSECGVTRHLPFEKLRKRMEAWTQAAPATVVWDVLFLMVYNMPADDRERVNKVVLLLKVTPYLVGHLPMCVPADKRLLARVMETEPAVAAPLLRDSLLQWLHQVRVQFDLQIGWPQTPTFQQTLARYRLGSA